jgi:hypothetical protein
MKRLTVHLTSAEALVIVLALDRYIVAAGHKPHVVADSARTSMEDALIGEPWPADLDPADALEGWATSREPA